MNFFSDVPNTDIYNFICESPLCWIVPDAAPSAACLMPVLFDDHSCHALFGHLPRRNPAVEALQANDSATCLFLGAQAYIPPEWVDKSDWVPTWNFVSVKVSGQIKLDEDFTLTAVDRLVKHMQKNTSSEWSFATVEHRLDELLAQIIGFRLHVNQIEPRFKLGQDEDESTYDNILDKLALHPLSNWMKKY